MKEIITTVMCLSFVTGMYEVVVETHDYHAVRYTGGGIMGYRYDKSDSRNELKSENYVRSLLSHEQWDELLKDGIIECNIQIF